MVLFAEYLLVSVPIRGLFNLTEKLSDDEQKMLELLVSVPIRGLFNLTEKSSDDEHNMLELVSVPIRGLFNLTRWEVEFDEDGYANEFPSPSGDYLI